MLQHDTMPQSLVSSAEQLFLQIGGDVGAAHLQSALGPVHASV